jgi:glycerate kinase
MPVVISKTVLVLTGPFGERLDAARVATAVARGLASNGRLEHDLCPLEVELGARAEGASKQLDEVDFDRRMRAARATVIVCAHLNDSTLAGSIAFEAATRARQSGVPAYAVTGRDALDRFEARILDLQLIIEARTPRALSAAGRKLAALV